MLKDEEEAKKLFKCFEEIASIFPREIDLVEIEEVAREVGRELAKRIGRIELPKPKTEIIDKKNFTVRGNFELLNVNLRGELKELFIKSPSPNFSILFMRDNSRIIDKKFTELQEVTQELEFIAAFDDNGSYVLNIKDIKWISQCMILLTAHEQITFQNIFARYDLFVL